MREADANLPGALGDGHQHDVHDADPADEQGHGGDSAQQPRQDCRGHRHGLHHLLHVADGEVILLVAGDAPALPEKPLNAGLHLRRIDIILGRNIDAGHVRVASDATLKGSDRHENGVVLIGSKARLPLGFKNSNHLTGDIVDTNAGPEGIRVPEQLVVHGLPDDAGCRPGPDLALKE